MIPCPVCGKAELLPKMIEEMNGEEVQQTLHNGKRQEPVYYCPDARPHDGHGMNLWTASKIKSYPARKKRLEKWRNNES